MKDIAQGISQRDRIGDGWQKLFIDINKFHPDINKFHSDHFQF